MTNQTPILNHQQIKSIIRRIAYEILENNLDEKEIIIAGICGNGFSLANIIAYELGIISQFSNVQICEVFVNKKNWLDQITCSLDLKELENKSVVLVDDVLNSGGTLIYGITYILNVKTKLFQTAVLVDRSHKKFPVKVDFKGISLSTSLQENIEVVLDKNNYQAYLR